MVEAGCYSGWEGWEEAYLKVLAFLRDGVEDEVLALSSGGDDSRADGDDRFECLSLCGEERLELFDELGDGVRDFELVRVRVRVGGGNEVLHGLAAVFVVGSWVDFFFFCFLHGGDCGLLCGFRKFLRGFLSSLAFESLLFLTLLRGVLGLAGELLDSDTGVLDGGGVGRRRGDDFFLLFGHWVARWWQRRSAFVTVAEAIYLRLCKSVRSRAISCDLSAAWPRNLSLL